MYQKFFEAKKKVVFTEIQPDFWYKETDELFEKTRGNGSWTYFDPHSEDPSHHYCELESGGIDLTGNFEYICDNPPIISNNGDITWSGNLYKAHYTDVQNALENGGELVFEWAASVVPLFELDENGDIKE